MLVPPFHAKVQIPSHAYALNGEGDIIQLFLTGATSFFIETKKKRSSRQCVEAAWCQWEAGSISIQVLQKAGTIRPTRGVEFDNLDFTLEMVVESARLVFELKVDRFRYRRVEAEFYEAGIR